MLVTGLLVLIISILDRSNLINGDMLRYFNYQFHDEFILDFDLNSLVLVLIFFVHWRRIIFIFIIL